MGRHSLLLPLGSESPALSATLISPRANARTPRFPMEIKSCGPVLGDGWGHRAIGVPIMAGEAMIHQHAAEITVFWGQHNPLLRCAGDHTSVAYLLIGNETIGPAAPSAAPTATTGWRTWKYRRIAKHAAAAARSFRVCPLKRPPAE